MVRVRETGVIYLYVVWVYVIFSGFLGCSCLFVH